MSWDYGDLEFWNSIHWDRAKTKLLEGGLFNPSMKDLFRSLEILEYADTKVAIIGQDPYPDPRMATGVAFSVPSDIRQHPPTLRNILIEYSEDLRLPIPENGNLEKWCSEGVLLWNSFPSCAAWRPGSHRWDEWRHLTKEIVTELSKRSIVFVLLGAEARVYSDYIDMELNEVIALSHPSPLGVRQTQSPFFRSRLFSTVNAKLKDMGHSPVDWRLDGDGQWRNSALSSTVTAGVSITMDSVTQGIATLAESLDLSSAFMDVAIP